MRGTASFLSGEYFVSGGLLGVTRDVLQRARPAGGSRPEDVELVARDAASLEPLPSTQKNGGAGARPGRVGLELAVARSGLRHG